MKQQHKIRYVVLSKTIPEYSKRDKTLYTCSVGYSPQLGFIRVYPLPLKSMNKWDIYEIMVEKNNRDSRVESWKLCSTSRFEQWDGIDQDITFMGKADQNFIINNMLSMSTKSIKDLNENKKSIGIIPIREYNLYWKENSRFVDSRQYGLFEDVELADFTNFTKETKSKESRIFFKDLKGEHDLQYNEWQVYEYQRKFKASNEAFRFLKNKNLILIGNMHSYRNTWLALGLFENKGIQYNLF